MDGRFAERGAGGRPSTGSRREDENGARRLRFSRAPGMGEDMGAANLPISGYSTLTATSSLASCAEVVKSSVDAPLTYTLVSSVEKVLPQHVFPLVWVINFWSLILSIITWWSAVFANMAGSSRTISCGYENHLRPDFGTHRTRCAACLALHWVPLVCLVPDQGVDNRCLRSNLAQHRWRRRVGTT